ncbi:hypothetical protein Cfor_02195 [Coptotermes formosanus]|uniref:Peptidyl-prolyl cis-trans isomerase n=1 Tax=Coptotermes formosanus TaxID=36987 RepID=A0A6L2Q7V1_COPFO|nr:hypothetical protein Cfor_02195 [Coptotermes formosanus]
MNKIPGFRKLTERLLRNIKPEGNQNGTISLKIISQPKEHGNNCEYIGAIHTANQAGGITDVFGTFTFTVKSVTVHTDVGDIKIELFCEYCPKACENFLALCASDYYNGCLFHRNIKGFIVQTGDPTHTGKGGNSIWGRKFEDEFKDELIDGSDTLDELEKLPVNPKNYKPLTDTRINSITIHANPLAG